MLVFTPHRAHFDAKFIRQAQASLWSDDGPSLRTPDAIQRGAQRGRDARVTGCVPSLEPFSFVASHAEEAQAVIKICCNCNAPSSTAGRGVRPRRS